MLLVLIILLCTQDSQASPRDLIERLRSEKIEEREEAARKLEEMGEKAESELEKAALDADSEVAERARGLLRKLPFREKLIAAIPDSIRLDLVSCLAFSPGGALRGLSSPRGR